MDKKVVIITGGSRGIGKSTAYKFASSNYDVVLTYNKDKISADRIKMELEKKYNIEVLTLQVDVSSEEEVKKMINETILRFGKINCLVNNAGICLDNNFDDKTVSEFHKVLDVNLIGPFLTSKYAYKYLMNEENSSIINVSSTNGIDTNYIESIDYDASKAGLISLTHNLAFEFKVKIRVNCVAPGWVETDMNKDLEKHFKESEIENIILKRFAKPDEIANVIYFLASDEASYINNEVIRVDGGLSR